MQQTSFPKSLSVWVNFSYNQNMFTLRPAQKQERWAIRRLIWEVGINPIGLNWRRFWVAVDENNVLVGCAQLKPHSDGCWEFASLAVKADKRGKGVAAVLIHKMKTLKSRPIYLMCRGGLVPFYQKFGFSEILESRDLPRHFQRIYTLSSWGRKIYPGWQGIAVMVNSA